MNGSKPQNDNVENFVRQNTRMIVKHSIEQPNSGTRHHRLYKCKDCNKEYDSFQALGGHRASHRTRKPEAPTDSSGMETPETQPKPKLHECKICKKGFEIGQSLGGHMRKHWKKKGRSAEDVVVADSCSSSSSSVVSSSNGGKMVFKFDLNLEPEEDEGVDGVQSDQDSYKSS